MSHMLPRMSKEEVLAVRQRLGNTQRVMAYELGVTERTYRRWEKETGAPPTPAELIRRLAADVEERRAEAAG